jgi:ribosomal protein L40E
MCFRPPGAAKNVKCTNCGMFNPPTLEKCRKCGSEIPKQMIPCPECGVMQPENNKVCANCGFNGKPGSGDPAKRKSANA